MAIVSEWRGWGRETHLATHWKPYRHLFPRLPERSRYNRRRRNLIRACNQLRQLVLTLLDVAQDAYGAIMPAGANGRCQRAAGSFPGQPAHAAARTRDPANHTLPAGH